MSSSSIRKFLIGSLIALAGMLYHQEIFEAVQRGLGRINAKYEASAESFFQMGKIAQEVPASLQTIKGLNEKSRSQENMLNEIVPAENRVPIKRAGLLTYDRKILDSLAGK